mgnify:CR=1 FL=1
MDSLEVTSSSWATDIIATAKATQAVHSVHNDGQTLIVAHSKDQKISEFDLEQYADKPARIRENITLCEIESFVDYYQRFADDKSIIKANLASRKFTAIFDYHSPGQPAWQAHTCSLVCKTSTEWDTWEATDGRQFNQIEFAEFIERNSIDIVDPAASVMLEIAMTLQANKKVKFNSGVRLDNGQVQLGYHEVVEGSAGKKGDLKIPDKFKLALRVFQGGEKYSVECHLRYRINDGTLIFFYQIIRPERLLEDAFELVKKQVSTGCPGATVFVVG